jgi:hypothetical protein
MIGPSGHFSLVRGYRRTWTQGQAKALVDKARARIELVDSTP